MISQGIILIAVIALIDVAQTQSLCGDCVIVPDASVVWRSGETRTIAWRATRAEQAALYLVSATEDRTGTVRDLMLYKDEPFLNATTAQVVGENTFVW